MKSPDLPVSRKPKGKAVILALLPATGRQLMARTGSAKSTIQKHLGDMMASRSICISDWTVGPTGHALAVYAVGDDAPMPQKSAKVKKPPADNIAAGAVKAQSSVFALAGVWA